MNPRHVLFSVVAAVSTTASLAQAAGSVTPNAPDPALGAFTQRLRAQYPATQIDTVAASALPGLYEVVMGRNVAYVDVSGRYFLFGHVWDMQARQDLTADRRTELDRIDLARLPRALALKSVTGTGRRVVTVLADPNCHYCRDLEHTLAATPDLTVYTYLLPILGDDSKQLAERIWCAGERDRARVWRDWMTKAVSPPATAGCETPLQTIATVAASLGVNGTPTLLAPDGRRHAGGMSEQELLAWLAPGPDPLAQGTPVTTRHPAP